MKLKTLSLLSLLFILGSTARSQEVAVVASNEVSYGTTVHTLSFPVAVVNHTAGSDDDASTDWSYTVQVDEVLAFIQEDQSVQHATFDNATRTYTVLTGSEYDITALVELINSKLTEGE